MATTFKRQLSVPGRLDDLPAIGEFIEEACTQAGVRQELRFDITLAVEEACTNIIEHAYKGNGGSFDVRFEVRDSDLVVTLRDHGQPFDPAAVIKPDFSLPLEERPLGGLGLHLMQKLMDEVRFSFSPKHGNELVMVKHDAVEE
jgi:anti-sigma regulatory factor (Ser/Thr protein kinase)